MTSQQGHTFDDYVDRGVPATAWGWALQTLLASAGVFAYALTPGVATTLASIFLAAPLALAVLLLLHEHLAVWLQWTLCLVLAAIGPIGYLLQGGDLWWHFGQWAVWPLVILMLARANYGADSRGGADSWGASSDGPWGPPDGA